MVNAFVAITAVLASTIAVASLSISVSAAPMPTGAWPTSAGKATPLSAPRTDNYPSHPLPSPPNSHHQVSTMVNAFTTAAAFLAVAVATTSTASVSAAPMPTGAWPTSAGKATPLSAPRTVKNGEVFDGKMMTYERSNIQCGGTETGWETAVFLVQPGGTVKNVIIGKNQAEGIHCEDGGCTIENVWWDDVCEDALTIKGGSASSVSNVIGGGARNAEDKVIQHNGQGTVSIDGFYVQDFGKLYRSCGECDVQPPRKVTVSNVYAVNPKTGIVTVNENFGDQAKLSNIKIKTARKFTDVTVCGWSQGVIGKGTATTPNHGPKPPLCQYSESTIQFLR